MTQDTVDLRKCLMVALEPGLHPSRVVAIWLAIQTYPGVASVTDLSAVSRETLDGMLFQPPPPVAKRKPRRTKVA